MVEKMGPEITLSRITKRGSCRFGDCGLKKQGLNSVFMPHECISEEIKSLREIYIGVNINCKYYGWEVVLYGSLNFFTSC